jgi:hypothetical protein
MVTGTTTQARISHGYSGIISIDTVTAIGEGASGPPQAARISSIYPNPFNPRTTIEYELGVGDSIELSIFDMRGRLVYSVESGSKTAGQHQATWNGVGRDGRSVPAGTYYCRLMTSHGANTQKLTLAK